MKSTMRIFSLLLVVVLALAMVTACSDEGTTGEKNALRSAKSYLDLTAFSYTGLIEQLEFEGFTTEQATYGADNCKAD